MNITTTISGVKELLDALKRKAVEAERGTERGVVKAGLFLQRKSMALCPVDKGFLYGSCSKESHRKGSGFETQYFVAYGTEYGIFVHENLEAYHKPPTCAKFLEKPAREHSGEILKIIKEEVQSGGRSGGNAQSAPPPMSNPTSSSSRKRDSKGRFLK